MTNCRHSNEFSTSGLDVAFQLWAKTDRDSDRWHALPYHLLDVGAAAGQLWDRLPPASRRIATDALGDPQTARQVVGFLSAIHDIGKANRFFQSKDNLQIQRLSHLGVKEADEHRKHGQATTALLEPWLAERWGWSPAAAIHLAIAVGGHHGVFRRDPGVERLELDQGYVPAATGAILDKLEDLYKLPESVAEPKNLNPFLAWLAGFVSVADWLGSHESMTVWLNQTEDLAQYAEQADDRAARLLESIEWATPQAGPSLSICDLIPEGFQPNHLQRVAAEIAASDFELAIVEAPTGEGKTEAAFALCETGRSLGGGVYFALPTMATANGIRDRVHRYLVEATGDRDLDTRLLHSQAWLYRSEVASVSNPQTDESQSTAEDWFAGSKRGLLAPYGVGTIDQCLIGALRAKHGFVRLFALAGKTVVVDEVHAYDVYMGDLLERLLGWLRALGCRVILLSATLPASRRQALIEAWGGTIPSDQASYPCITWVGSPGEVHSRGLEVAPRKPVAYNLLSSEKDAGWQLGADKLLALVRENGGFGALVLNTVKEAQAAFEYLADAQRDIQVDLFHARYTMRDRAVIEARVLETYGKNGNRGLPRILVATQVVEQSLDLDFDFMVSALAPIDLLIQRAGRLHRHRRTLDGRLRTGHAGEEPDQRPAPALYVIPTTSDERIYASDVLLRTQDCLERGCIIREPKDVSAAVDAVYEALSPETDRDEYRDRLAKACERAQSKRDRHHDKAEEAMICEVDGWYLITDVRNGLDENDETPGSEMAARTRLEELPSVNLVLLSAADGGRRIDFSKGGKRELALRTVRAPAYADCLEELESLPKPLGWDKTGASKHAIAIFLDNHGRFETPTFEFRYDRQVGLTISRKNA